jgi:hypothetical protein
VLVSSTILLWRRDIVDCEGLLLLSFPNCCSCTSVVILEIARYLHSQEIELLTVLSW